MTEVTDLPEGWIVANPDGSVAKRLHFPIEIDGGIQETITCQRIKAGHLRALAGLNINFENLDMGRLYSHVADNLAPGLTGLTPAQFDKLDVQDLAEVIGIFSDFFDGTLPIGKMFGAQ